MPTVFNKNFDYYLSTYDSESEFKNLESIREIYPPDSNFSKRLNGRNFPQWCVLTEKRVPNSVPYFETDDPHNPNDSSSLTHYILSENNDAIIGTVRFENHEYIARDNDNNIVWETREQTKFLTKETIEGIERGEDVKIHSTIIFKYGYFRILSIKINWLPTY